MIYEVRLTRKAEKDLIQCPLPIRMKFQIWVSAIRNEGLEIVRRIPGYHDEPLKGKRIGQRSIRLNKAYRAIYRIISESKVEFVSVEEVNKHEY